MRRENLSQAGRMPSVFARNTAQVNETMVRILAHCAVVILVMAALSAVGFFEFGAGYTWILLGVGLPVCLLPKLLIRVLPDRAMQYLMMVSAALFIGIIGADKNIGVYITYILVPLLSCLYFEPVFVLRSSALCYAVMLLSLYAASAELPEVLYQGRPRGQMFFAYAVGFTLEYSVTAWVLYYLVKRAKRLLVECVNAEKVLAEAEKEKQAQEMLENEVAALRNVHRALGSGAWKLQYDEQGNMTACHWSDTMRHMLGFQSQEDFPDRFESWLDRLHPEDKERTMQEYRQAVMDYTGQTVYDVEYRVMDKSGAYHWFRAAGQLSRRPDGSPIAFDGVFINTTERHETTERLHRALQETEEAKNELLLEHEVISAVSRGYFSIYSIDLAADEYEEISNSDRSMHLPTGHWGSAQKKLYELCLSLVAEGYQDAVMRFFDLSTLASRMGESETVELEYFAADGNWHQARFIEKKRDETGKVTTVLYVTRIVSQQKQQEMEQERLRLAYQAAESANEAKTTFLLNMSHDIRTPMNAILGYSGLMRERLQDPELLHYQEMIQRSGNLLLSIINNVLDMARIESGKMELDENYDQVGDIAGNVCSVFEAEAKRKHLTMTHSVDVTHTHIMCDKTKLQELLTNLVSNAVKYTPPGGSVSVAIRELPSEKPGYVCIQTTVADTGIGMSQEFLPHLFDSFSRERNTTAGKVAGSGLGMAIVKSLVELMGGTITVESTLGKGTTFTVTLFHKLADAAYYAHQEHIEAVSQVDFSGKKILLAEDNDLNAEIAIAILEEMGFAVDRAEDGIVCVDKLERAPEHTYDVVLMDIQMPNMDGYKAAQVIRHLPDSAKANIPIIAMTANAFEEDRKAALENGMNGHIAKPIDVEKVRETLARVLG